MNKPLLIACACLATAAVVTGIWLWPSSAASGAAEYRPDDGPDRRERAVVAISREGRASVPRLREVLATERDPQVKAAAITGLGEHYDYASIEPLLDAMRSDSRLVRARAHTAVARMVGMTIVIDNPDDPAQWDQAVRNYRRVWASMENTQRLVDFKGQLDRNYGAIP